MANNAGDGVEQSRRRRARAADQEAVTGFRPTQAGSSGLPTAMSLVQRREFDEISADAVHAGDFVGYITDVRKTAARSLVAGLVVPKVYQHELIDAMDASSLGLVMVRVYVVPRSKFMEGDDADGDDSVA